MAKKSKAQGSKKTAKAGALKAPGEKKKVDLDPQAQADAQLLQALEDAMERGSYAGVRRIAAHAGGELRPATREAVDAIVERTRPDPVQLGVAAFAILCVLVTGALTLATPAKVEATSPPPTAAP